MIITANRASALLFRFLKTFPGKYIVPANVCPVVPLTCKLANVDIEFFDISDSTLCVNEKAIIDALTYNPAEYSGVIFVHTYGYQYDTSGFFSQLKSIRGDIKIIDDKCLCFPDFDPLAEHVDMELFSTGHAKPVDLGFGAYAKLNEGTQLQSFNSVFAEDSLILLEQTYKRNLESGEMMEFIPNHWLDTTDIAMKFEKFASLIVEKTALVAKQKDHLNSIYRNELPLDFCLTDDFQHWRFNLMLERKDHIMKGIFNEGLFASAHYVPSSRLFEKKQYKVADLLAQKVLNLFNDFYFSENQAYSICKVINRYL